MLVYLNNKELSNFLDHLILWHQNFRLHQFNWGRQNTHIIWVGIPWKQLLGWWKGRWEDNIKIDPNSIDCEDSIWLELVQDYVWWQALWQAVLNFHFCTIRNSINICNRKRQANTFALIWEWWQHYSATLVYCLEV